MMKRFVAVGAAGLSVFLSGCLGGGTSVLEGRLRSQEQAMFQLNQEMLQVRQELEASRREAEYLRSQMVHSGQPHILPEQADQLFRVEKIQLNKMMSGGLNRDMAEGDDVLAINVIPVDGDGQPLKLPGTITIEALDLRQAGAQREVGRWRFETAESLEHWNKGLIGSGYMFLLPWQQVPVSEELTVHVRLDAPDGRSFDVTEIVTINPPAALTPQPPAPLPESTTIAPIPMPPAPPVQEETPANPFPVPEPTPYEADPQPAPSDMQPGAVPVEGPLPSIQPMPMKTEPVNPASALSPNPPLLVIPQEKPTVVPISQQVIPPAPNGPPVTSGNETVTLEEFLGGSPIRPTDRIVIPTEQRTDLIVPGTSTPNGVPGQPDEDWSISIQPRAK